MLITRDIVRDSVKLAREKMSELLTKPRSIFKEPDEDDPNTPSIIALN